MTSKQLKQIKEFSLSYYQKTDQFHDARHPILTTTYALTLAKDYPETNLLVLEAICYLHDIGRIRADESHAYESAKIAEPFLKKIGITSEEAEVILHAVSVHAA
ncbi:MAG: HD domain-containing protein, partial [Patescibacteria group bacterium]|nr:HD domain-containing protein [Patescibacteria group bacterium]